LSKFGFQVNRKIVCSVQGKFGGKFVLEKLFANFVWKAAN